MKRLIPVGLAVALVLAMAALPCSASNEPILLRMNMNPGEVYRLRTTMDQTGTVKMSGMDVRTQQHMILEASYVVDSVESDGSIRMTCTCENLSMHISNPSGEISFDSRSPENAVPEVAAIFGALIGARLQLRMSPTGRVLECKGIEDIFDKMLGSLDPEQRKAAQKTLAGQLNIQHVFMGLDQYPEHPVQVGDSWNTEATANGEFPMTISTNYIISDCRNGICMVDIVSDIVSSSVQSSPGSALVGIEMKGTQTGTLEIDANTGWVVQSRLHLKASGNMTMLLTAETAPITFETTIVSEAY